MLFICLNNFLCPISFSYCNLYSFGHTDSYTHSLRHQGWFAQAKRDPTVLASLHQSVIVLWATLFIISIWPILALWPNKDFISAPDFHCNGVKVSLVIDSIKPFLCFFMCFLHNGIHGKKMTMLSIMPSDLADCGNLLCFWMKNYEELLTPVARSSWILQSAWKSLSKKVVGKVSLNWSEMIFGVVVET